MDFKKMISNYVEYWAPLAMGAGLAFIIVYSRITSSGWTAWLGLGISIAALVIGIILAPQKKTLWPWSRALTVFGVTYILLYLASADWQKVVEGGIAIVAGFLLTPSKK